MSAAATELEQMIINELAVRKRKLIAMEKELDRLCALLIDLRNGKRLNSKKYQSMIRSFRVKKSKQG